MIDLFSNVEHTKIEDLCVFQCKQYQDERGLFKKFLDKSLLKMIKKNPTECYVSTSAKNSVRGLHFQKEPFTQYKIVTCLTGRFLDVVVDLRQDSSTFGNSFSIELTALNGRVLYVPPLFAHGIISLEDETTMLSMSSTGYYPEYEDGIRIDSLGLELDYEQLTFSPKDLKLQTLTQYLSKHEAN